MKITSEWVIVVLTTMTMSGGAGAWLHAQYVARRKALPIIRAEWRTGTIAHTVHLHIINRLDEDLYIVKAEADQGFLVNVGARDPVLSSISPTWEERPSPMELDWMIAPVSESKQELSVGKSRRLTITMSSSARTLRSKRVTIRDSHRE
jgi:hypothetical protein